MNTALRPMSTGEVLDRTFNLYRRNFVLFFGIGLLPPVLKLLVRLTPLSTVPLEQTGSPVAGNAAIAAGVGTLIFIVAWVIGYAVSQAATVYAVSAVHLGRKTSIKESYGRVRGRYLRVLGLVLLTIVIVFGGMAVIIAAGVVLGTGLVRSGASGVAAFVFGGAFLLGLAVAIYYALRFAVAIPACVLEELKIIASLRRSTNLTKNDRGRIFVIYFLFVVLMYIVAIALGIVVAVVTGAGADENSVQMRMLTYLAEFLAEAFVGPIIAIALALVYYDERVRKEAFDLQLMMTTTLDKPVVGTAMAGAPKF